MVAQHIPQTEVCGPLWCKQLVRGDWNPKTGEKNQGNGALMHTEENTHKKVMSLGTNCCIYTAHIPVILHYHQLPRFFSNLMQLTGGYTVLSDVY